MAEVASRESPSENSGADSPKESGAPVAEAAKKNSKKKKGWLISRLWKGMFGSASEDFEKKLQYLSKEEAIVHARLKRRAHSSRTKSRNIIVLSIFLEVVAVAYAVMTTRSVNLDWKTRAIRVLPMFGLPVVSTLIYSLLVRFTRMLNRKDQKALERLRAERQAKIDELKERTNYYSTQQLIQRYDLDPAAKQAAASVLASKLGADAGLKFYLGDESSNTKPPSGRSTDAAVVVGSSGLRNRKQSLIRSNSTGSDALTQFIDETSMKYNSAADGQEDTPAGGHRVVEHFKGPNPNDGGWLARIASLLVGEDPTQCHALVCGNCHMHNGLARMEDFPSITYYCPRCQALNVSKQQDDHGSSHSATPGDGNSLGSITGTIASNLVTVQEQPAVDDAEEI